MPIFAEVLETHDLTAQKSGMIAHPDFANASFWTISRTVPQAEALDKPLRETKLDLDAVLISVIIAWYTATRFLMTCTSWSPRR